MRILRIRHGFQADHSSSSYLFYAVDRPVSAAGQRIAHRFSSRADVDKQFARYQKWGESSLSSDAFPALLGEHYDVMASESYDSWTLMIAVPKTRRMETLLRPFTAIDDGEFQRLSVHDYGKRLAIELFCEINYDAVLGSRHGDLFEYLVELLAKIRAEIVQGDFSFLQAVAQFYGAGAEDEEDAEDEQAEQEPPAPSAAATRAELQQECLRRGIPCRKSWTRDQLRAALAVVAVPPVSGARPPAPPALREQPLKLSRAGLQIVNALDRR